MGTADPLHLEPAHSINLWATVAYLCKISFLTCTSHHSSEKQLFKRLRKAGAIEKIEFVERTSAEESKKDLDSSCWPQGRMARVVCATAKVSAWEAIYLRVTESTSNVFGTTLPRTQRK